MLAVGAGPHDAGISGLIQQLKTDIFVRWMRAAQKQALLEWRDRTDPPGLMARFEKAGHSFYGFGDRMASTEHRKGYTPDFVKTGRLRDSMKSRRPVSVNGQGVDVITRFRYGGGVLNFPSLSKLSIASENRIRTTSVSEVRGSQRDAYTRKGPGGTVISVRSYSAGGYQGTRHGVHTVITHTARTYPQEFQEFSKDAAWLKARVEQIMLEKVRKMVYHNGKIATRFLESSNVGV